jgi:Txe/YoeB family toxin of Txe-Axe toxin-antitoxin module
MSNIAKRSINAEVSSLKRNKMTYSTPYKRACHNQEKVKKSFKVMIRLVNPNPLKKIDFEKLDYAFNDK